MNWLQRTAQQWLEAHPDYDIGDHLHAAFSSVFPETDGKSWEEVPDIFYVKSKTHPYLGNNSTNMGSFFMYMNRFYRLDVLIWQATPNSTEHDTITFMKQHGFTGKLNRVYDKELGSDTKELGTITAENPKDFIDQVIVLIKSDFDRGEEGDNDDLFPQWPYPEEEVNEEEMSIIKRNPGYMG